MGHNHARGVNGGVAAQSISQPYMCVFSTGQSRLVWDGAEESHWEICARRIPVIVEGFTTTKLTFALSARYDTSTGRFSNMAAGSTSEFIRPGEHLLVLDARLNGRNLSYSLSTNSYRFVNIIDLDTKLISPGEIATLKDAHSAEQLFITVSAAAFYNDTLLTSETEIGGGRVFAWRGNFFSDGKEYVYVECLAPVNCKGAIGFIPKTSLSEITFVERMTEMFPLVIEYPTLALEKRCNVASKVISSAEIKSAISLKAPFAALAGAELSASVEAALKTVREEVYDADVKVERTIFTVFKFREPRWWESNRWHTRSIRVLIVDRVTTGCNSDNPMVHFELRTESGSIEITEPQANADITSSVVYTRFVTQAQARTRGRVKTWALSYIASALSALRKQ
ncbi:hypothetical protein [Labrenzia sp. DG1229]|uniref:hypothetical protein n=1 Tax=Labrenzia sp. DG1229 TaxID=681847 RepID=UPI00048F5B1E|nr:hypothetical protein [Labrenzia sp. DG1229]